MSDTPTAPEVIVLDIVDALGGRVQYATIKGMIRKQLRPYLRTIISPMLGRGWLTKSFMGQYAITEEGRKALRWMQAAAAKPVG